MHSIIYSRFEGYINKGYDVKCLTSYRRIVKRVEHTIVPSTIYLGHSWFVINKERTALFVINIITSVVNLMVTNSVGDRTIKYRLIVVKEIMRVVENYAKSLKISQILVADPCVELTNSDLRDTGMKS